MLLPTVLGALALVLAIGAPAVLTLRPWQLLHPRTALTLWYAALGAGLGLAVAAVASTIFLATISTPYSEAGEAAILSITAWLLLGLVGAAVGFILTAASSTPGRRFRSDLAVSREERDGFTLVRFDDPVPHAYSLPGAHPEIFYSSTLRSCLSQSEFAAVIAHEYAHLRQHHGAALRIADLNATCLPFLPAGRALKRATRLLIELAADDAAARQVGPTHLANALARLSSQTGDVSLAIRAERLSDKKWPISRRRRLPHALRPLAAADAQRIR
ncbi:M56 family metallopeptidase [Microbacterium sp. SA39]|uniref:M56 family metallopeptidase n=1 Tax=Microbacterium sp. SA39 TaxID=1263625 RepID=UPI00061E5392|nr:M56 family metallopeptidase [Microbacterium sp. SA39]KJQ53184.1 Peptidase family M48 [Microbacterium sp. SA39]